MCYIVFAIIIYSFIFVNCNQLLITDLHEWIDQYSDCLITLIADTKNVFISQQSFHRHPIFLSDGTKILQPIVFRKYIYCVTYFFLFPNQHRIEQNDSYIGHTLFNVGIISLRAEIQEVWEKDWHSSIERNDLLIFSEKDKTIWHDDLGGYSSNKASIVYFISLNPANYSSDSTILAYESTQGPGFYLCRLCLPLNFAWIPFGSKSCRKTGYETRTSIEQSGRAIYTHIGDEVRSHILAATYQKHLSLNLHTIYPFYQNFDGITETGEELTANIEHLVFQVLNTSGLLENKDVFNNGWISFKPRRNHRPWFTYSRVIRVKKYYYQAVSFTRKVTLNFVTCDGVHHPVWTGLKASSIVDFYIYCMFPLLLLLSLIAAIIASTYQQRIKNCWQFFSLYFWMAVSGLLEVSWPANFKSVVVLQNSNNSHTKIKVLFGALYWLLGVWLAVVLVFNNHSKSEIVSTFVSPLPSVTSWNFINQLKDFKIITPVEPKVRYGQTSEVDNSIRQTNLGNTASTLKAFSEIRSETDRVIFGFWKDESGYRVNLAEEEKIYDFVKECRHTAFIDVKDRMHYFLDYFNSRAEKGIIFMEGKDDISTLVEAWTIFDYDEAICGVIYRRLQSLISSGIHSIFEKWVMHRSKYHKGLHLRSCNHSHTVAVNLESVLGITYALLALISLAGLMLVIEIVYWNFCKICYQYMRSRGLRGKKRVFTL